MNAFRKLQIAVALAVVFAMGVAVGIDAVSALKPCKSHGNIEWRKHWGCPECLREEDERLVFANPWRYPSRGELPEKRGFYLVTTDFNTVEQFLWDQGAFFVLPVELMSVRAWRELPDPAPELEEEQ